MDDARDVLRGIWTANQTSREELDEAFGEGRSCKSTRHMGFGGFVEQRPGSRTEVDGDLRAAWRATLEREGKRTEGSASSDALHER